MPRPSRDRPAKTSTSTGFQHVGRSGRPWLVILSLKKERVRRGEKRDREELAHETVQTVQHPAIPVFVRVYADGLTPSRDRPETVQLLRPYQ